MSISIHLPKLYSLFFSVSFWGSKQVDFVFFCAQYHMPFYMQYLAMWPEYFSLAESPGGNIMAYMIGKAEGKGENWHGHVSAVTVAPEFRRLGLAQQLMNALEDISEKL
jgi:N-terminal acetyltransferase B complex catalytic subunit